jgi:hypothetical protein
MTLRAENMPVFSDRELCVYLDSNYRDEIKINIGGVCKHLRSDLGVKLEDAYRVARKWWRRCVETDLMNGKVVTFPNKIPNLSYRWDGL